MIDRRARSTPTRLVFVYEVTSTDTSSPGSDGVRVRCLGREIELDWGSIKDAESGWTTMDGPPVTT